MSRSSTRSRSRTWQNRHTLASYPPGPLQSSGSTGRTDDRTVWPNQDRCCWDLSLPASSLSRNLSFMIDQGLSLQDVILGSYSMNSMVWNLWDCCLRRINVQVKNTLKVPPAKTFFFIMIFAWFWSQQGVAWEMCGSKYVTAWEMRGSKYVTAWKRWGSKYGCMRNVQFEALSGALEI